MMSHRVHNCIAAKAFMVLFRVIPTALVVPMIALMIALPLTMYTTGCGSKTQSQINTIITDINTWAPTAAADITALAADVVQFDPGDANVINGFVTTMQNAVTPLQTLCKDYLANPTANLLSQITSFITQIATSDSQAILALGGIKNANSKQIAQGILAAIATVMTIMTGLLQSAGLITASIVLPNNFKFDEKIEAKVMQQFKTQGLIAQDVTTKQIIAQLQAHKVIVFV